VAVLPQRTGPNCDIDGASRLYWRFCCHDALRTEPPTADVDVLEIAPRAVADAFSQVAMLGGPLFQKYGVYLDRVTIAQPPYEYESRLQEMFPGAFQN
jgi:hypothetical protein